MFSRRFVWIGLVLYIGLGRQTATAEPQSESSRGACETSSGCLIASPDSCAAQRGTYKGHGTRCPQGACITSTVCAEFTSSQSCSIMGGLFMGPGSSCLNCATDRDCGSGLHCGPDKDCVLQTFTIPTTSTWGVVVLALLILTAAKLQLRGPSIRTR